MCNKAIIDVHLGFLITRMGMVSVILALADYMKFKFINNDTFITVITRKVANKS